ncbi:MAG TPA: hypothetical protein VMF87_20235 [Streptosporangiaceae bacterium]|jgi:hypothetical protein|nr:hypothetical protein [Streptosporangiaceae bacterium]
MTTSSEYADPSDHAAPAGTSLQTDEAKATVAEIKAENVALKQADVVAEARAEAVVEQAKLLTEVADNVLEELREGTPEAG